MTPGRELAAPSAGLANLRDQRPLIELRPRRRLHMATSKYTKLFSPLQLRNGNSLINRAIMGSMHTGLEEGSGFWHGLEKMAGFFEERARGHVGLIVTGGIAPNSAGRVAPTFQLGIALSLGLGRWGRVVRVGWRLEQVRPLFFGLLVSLQAASS